MQAFESRLLSMLRAGVAALRARARLPRGLHLPQMGLRRAQAWLGRARPRLWIALIAILVLPLVAATNLAYQVARKPTELLSPLGDSFDKTPQQTWRQYGAHFREYSTAAVSPELLAALAQAEGAGNPLAHTYWRWRFSWNPLAVYQPASSAVGMFQMTDAAFADSRRFCIHDHAVTDDCWFTGLYSRLLPSHAIELAAVSLDRQMAAILARLPRAAPTPKQRQDLAAVVHLCGAGPALAFARRGFHLAPGARCGDHDPAAYVAKVDALALLFRRLAATS